MNTILRQCATSAVVISMLTACVSAQPTYSTPAPVYTPPVSSNTNNNNTVIGAGSGAALGGLIGAAVSKNGKKNEGALIGAAIGGLLGGVIGNQYGTQIKDILHGTGSSVATMPDGSVKINLSGDASFNVGSAVIKNEFMGTLDKVAKELAAQPNSRIMIVGFTDDVGNPDANQRLSLARANSVRDFFATSGVSFSRMSTSGRGEAQPVASNATEAGRAQNRRVEVFVFPEGK
ncbi:MAG: OmpA family protein [Formosimonas sp.]